MSERDDVESAVTGEAALANDTVPETPADEPATGASDVESVPPPTTDGEEPPANESADESASEVESAGDRDGTDETADETADDTADQTAPAVVERSAALSLQEAPERAGRRVRAGLRVGTRVALGLVVASVLPAAAVAGLLLSSTPEDVVALRAQLAFGALALSLVLSLALGLWLRADLSRGLTALEARLRLLASGQPSARGDETRPGELHALDDVADALCATLGTLREREEAARAHGERLFALAERVDAIANGDLSTRLPPSDDVAEASLAAAVNRLVDAFERRVVRLKSHARLLSSSGTSTTPPAFDEGEDDPVALVEKRVGGLRPIPPLLNDIAGRLATLSRMPRGEPRVADDLARLSEAIAQRARAAQALFDSLEAQLPRLPRDAGQEGAGLSADQQRALEKLAEELEALTVDTSLPRLVESLPDLSAGDVASRLARRKAGA